MEERIVSALDIGTTKICVVVCKITSLSQVEVLGVGSDFSAGLSKGLIVNVDATVRSITKAVEEAEMMSGYQVGPLYVSISGTQSECVTSKGVIAVSSKGGEISEEDVTRVIGTARSISIPADREILHVIPKEFVVDNQEGIINPIGMYGVRLEADVYLVTCPQTATNNIRRTVEKSGYEVEDIVLQSVASAEATLNEDEKELGAILIDIGGGTTDVVVYTNNSIWQTCTVPYGGNNVTKDISYGLRTSLSSAESIKLRYGCSIESSVDSAEYFSVPLMGGRTPAKVSRRMLCGIIEPRMRELFTLVKSQLDQFGFPEKSVASVVLTGGGSLCEGAIELAESIFDLPVRIGSPRGIVGIVDKVNSPIFSTAVGLARFKSIELEAVGYEDEGEPSGLVGRIRGIFREFFQ